MRCLNGLETPDQGHIKINNVCLNTADQGKKQEILARIGTVFQTYNLLSRLTVVENIALPLQWAGHSKEQSLKQAEEMAERVGLRDKLQSYPSNLSGGQRQRVAIARALVGDAQLLLCDEFTAALDPETSLEILELLRTLNQDLGVTIILITHDMAVVREVSDVVHVMEQGAIVESGDITEVMLYPQHPVTSSLVQGLFLKSLPKYLRDHLSPDELQGGNHQQVLLRLVFSGHSSQQPVIAHLIQQYNLTVNILVGSLDHIRETAIGSLIISLPYAAPALKIALAHFESNGVAANVLGYVAEGR